MPPSIGYAGRGTLVQISTNGGSSYTHILQVRKGDYSGMKATLADITNFDSPSAVIERIPTVIDPGEYKGDGVLNPGDSSVALLNTLLINQTLVLFQLTYIDGTVDSFSGYVTEWTPSTADVKKELGYAFTFTITGPVTRTAASGATPTITALNPSSMVHGVANPLQITGTTFFNAQGTGSVTIGGTAATVIFWSNTVIIVSLPTGLLAGSQNVIVTNAAGHATSPDALTLT